jgi:putative ABC transport system permease protein
MTFSKLLFKNVKQHLNESVAYLLACAIAIMIYFSFNVMTHAPHLVTLIAEPAQLLGVFAFAKVVICLLVLTFMAAANTVLLQQRRQELTLLKVLGSSRFSIASLFFLEQILFGGVALLLGVGLGLLLTRLFTLILLRFMQVTQAAPQFLFSWTALGQTVGIFCCFFLLMGLYDVLLIQRQPLRLRPVTNAADITRWFTWPFALIGVVLTALGFGMAQNFFQTIQFYNRFFNTNSGLLVILVSILGFVVLGLALIYRWSLPLLVRQLRRHQRWSYQGLRPVMLVNLRRDLHENAMTLWVITLTIASTLVILGSIAMGREILQRSLDNTSPTAITVADDAFPAVQRTLKQQGIHVQADHVATFKLVPSAFQLQSFLRLHPMTETLPLTVISLSDYRQAQQFQPTLPRLQLTTGEGVILKQEANYFTLPLQTVTQTVHLKDPQVPQVKLVGISGQFAFGTLRYVSSGLVVADQTFAQLRDEGAVRYHAIAFTQTQHSLTVSRQLLKQFDNRLIYFKATKNKLKRQAQRTTGAYTLPVLTARYPTQVSDQMGYGLLIYVCLFLSCVFMLVSGGMMLLKQLGNSSQLQQQYRLLTKIGLASADLKKMVRWQVGFLFELPVLFGSCCAYFALHILSVLLFGTSLKLALFIAGGYVVVYGGFSHITTQLIWQRVTKKESRSDSFN